MAALKRLTLAEQAYEELQSQIVLGTLSAGDRLLPEDIAGRLEISQTPVKEALVQLERDGLIEGGSRHGSVVRRFNHQDLLEIFDVRILLERDAVTRGLAQGRVTADTISRLRVNFEAHLREVRRQEEAALPTAIFIDCNFHEILLELSANRTMREWHRMVMRQTQAARNYTVQLYSLERLEREHGAIIDALASDDKDRAVAAVVGHLEASLAELLSRAPEDFPTRT